VISQIIAFCTQRTRSRRLTHQAMGGDIARPIGGAKGGHELGQKS
jgi:hypothetical protein